MTQNRFLLILLNFFIIFSCSSKRNIIYLQDAEETSSFSLKYEEYKIAVDDILKISIVPNAPEFLDSFNPNAVNAQNREALLYEGYQVGLDGNIYYPMIGKIHVEGKTLSQIRELLVSEVIGSQFLKNPRIDVKLLNTHFTILGEVKSPGRYVFLKNNINILEAIGMAGDLTINGLRNDIKIIRDISGTKKITSIDLTNSEFINDNFQIFSGDIIIVNPNTTRVKNAGIIGNSGTLLSLLSFILSSIIVINN